MNGNGIVHWIVRIGCIGVYAVWASAWAGPGTGGEATGRQASRGDEASAVHKSGTAALDAGSDDQLRSRDDLFEEDTGTPTGKSEKAGTVGTFSGIRGFVQAEIARTTVAPVHWSTMMARADLGAQGNFGNGVKWKIGARADYDFVYGLTDYYPEAVRHDQRSSLSLRENYVDINSGDWDYRIGRQQVVWGEMVGLFFADVVSAKDMREFILPDFDTLRIPQWAARAEYFKGKFHSELLWVPIPSYDEIGNPGAEFYPYSLPAPPGFATRYRDEVRPSRTLSHTNYGLRLSLLHEGWDMSAFAYHSLDTSPTFYRDILPAPATIIYEARHDRINQLGATLSKDLGTGVFKAEAVYTQGRQFSVFRLTDDNGVVPQKTLDWVVGLDFASAEGARLDVQLFERVFFNHDPGILYRKVESGYSLLLGDKLTDRLEAQVLLISSLNRNDWLLRPRLTWRYPDNWRLAIGADIFGGAPLGMFGRFDSNDRVYMEFRKTF